MFYHRRSCLIHPENFMYQIQVLEVTMAIKANDVPALGYVQYSIDTQKDSHKETADKSS
ncbi:MAG: hypothetical protein ACLS54_08820 [Anaerostipes hadrus]